jgi:YidC/Oxa1 family membrane protein insertase
MEKRLLLAIVLSFAVLFGYQLLFQKKPANVQPVGPAPVETTAAAPAPTVANPVAEKTASIGGVTAAAPALKPTGAAGETKTKIETSMYEAVWSNKGGVLVSWKLKKHLDSAKKPLELVPKAAEITGIFPFSLMEDASSSLPLLDFAALKTDPLNGALYETTASDQSIKDGEKGEIRFRYSDGRDLEAEKIYTFTGGRYDFQVEVRITRAGKPVEPRLLWGPGLGNPMSEELKKSFGAGGGMTALASTNTYRVDEAKYKPEQSLINFTTWAAYDDNYFCALFLPATEAGSAALLRKDGETFPYYYLAVSRPGRVFIGPKDYDILGAFGHEAKKLVRFGTFGIFAEGLFAVIKAIHKAVPNWGWSIIILTLLIKIVFFPLTYQSTKSMAKMAELQPKIKALRNKYKNAKRDIAQRREMNEEMMKLYKQHGVNPAGGCLPLLIQIPFFFGIFSMLRAAIEFRQSPWLLWIGDLSVRDPLYVTPILMGITQFISQKMTPTSADPAQARMMLIMPAVMTIFFMNFQSGLVLYWLTSNVLQIGQQYLMNRMIQKKKSESNNGKPRKK